MSDQDLTLTLYSYNFRSRGERVMWALNETGLTYQLVRLNPLKGENRTPEFLALNPGARIPVLVHGEFVLTESLAILDYVGGLAPELELVPSSDVARHRYRPVFRAHISVRGLRVAQLIRKMHVSRIHYNGTRLKTH